MEYSLKRRAYNPFAGVRANGYAGVGAMSGNFYAGARAGTMVRSTVGYNQRRFYPGRNYRAYSAPSYGRFGTGRGPHAQIEKKFYDTVLSLGATAGLASTTQATGGVNLTMLQNATASGRIGQKIIIKSIQCKLSFGLAAGATDNDLYHFYLIQDTQANGAFPVMADMFDAGTIGLAMRNIANGNRFKILKHLHVRLNADAGVAAAFGGDAQQHDFFLKCNIPISYNAAAGAIAELRSNNLFVIYGSANGVATASGVCRLRYTDV